MKLKRMLSLVLCLLLVLSAFDALAARDYYDKPGCTGAKTTGTHHYVIARDSIEPTCTKAGKAIYRCVYCGKEESETVPALGHKWGEWDPYAPATCTQAAPAARWCERCNTEEKGTVGRPLGHDWDDWSTKQKATCTEEGLRWTDCNRCGWEKTEPIPALGHDWGEWYIEKYATESEDGLRRRDCSRCDAFETEPYSLEPSTDGPQLTIEAWPDHYDAERMYVGYKVTNTGSVPVKIKRAYTQTPEGEVRCNLGFPLDIEDYYHLLAPGETADTFLPVPDTTIYDEERKQGYADFLFVCLGQTESGERVESNIVPIHFELPKEESGLAPISIVLEASTAGVSGGKLYIDAKVRNASETSEETDLVDWGINIFNVDETDTLNTKWKATDECKPFCWRSSFTSDYAFNEIIYATATTEELASGHKKVKVQAYGYDSKYNTYVSNMVTLDFTFDPVNPDANEDLVFTLDAEKAGVSDGKLYIDAVVYNLSEWSEETTLFDWGIRLINPDDTINMDWKAADKCKPFHGYSSYSSDYAFDEPMYAKADTEQTAPFSQTVLVQAYGYDAQHHIYLTDKVSLTFDIGAADTDVGNETVLTLTASEIGVIDGKLYIDAEVHNLSEWGEKTTLVDWGIDIFNDDETDSLNIKWKATDKCKPFHGQAMFTSDFAFEEDMYALATPEELASGQKTVKVQAYGRNAANMVFQSNTVTLNFDFTPVSTNGRVSDEIILKLMALTDVIDENRLYVNAIVTNDSEFIEATRLENWGIDIFNEDGSLNTTWNPSDDCKPFHGNSSFSSDYAFEGGIYAVALPEDLGAGFKTVKVQAFGLDSQDNTYVSEMVPLTFRFEKDEPEKPAYALKLEVSKIDEKPLYGEEETWYQYTITNTGTEPLKNVSLTYGNLDGALWYAYTDITSLLPAGQSISGYGSIFLWFNHADSNGLEEIEFTAYGAEPLDDFQNWHLSDDVTLSYQLDETIWNPPATDRTNMRIEKRVRNFAANGEYFTEGEVIVYEVTVTNKGPGWTYDVTVCDELPHYDENGDSDIVIDYLLMMQPEESETYIIMHEVTAEEAQQGYVRNYAYVLWSDEEGGSKDHIEEVELYTTADVFEPEEKVSVYKEVINTSKNGIYFTTGETIKYRVTVYNMNDYDITALFVDDSLVGTVYGDFGTIPAGYSWSFEYDYEVTYWDAIENGFVENTATAYYYDANLYRRVVDSNTVRVPVTDRHKEPHLSVFMKETSHPQHDGLYYEDEIIDYAIVVVNDGSEDLYNIDVSAFRVLDGGNLLLGTIPYIAAGQYYSFVPCQTRVDKWDVDYISCVLNFAVVETYTQDYTYLWAQSLDVISPVGAPDKPYNPDDPHTGTPIEGKDDYCKLTLTAVGSGIESYQQHYCAEHYDAVSALYSAAETAETVEEKLAALTEIRAAWIAEIDEMYDSLATTMAVEDISAVISERMVFYAYINSCEQLFAAEYAADEAAEKLCAILADKCAELCYELNAPEGTRTDSWLSGHSIISEPAVNETCAESDRGSFARETAFTLNLCGEHAQLAKTIREDVLSLVTDAERETAFNGGYRKWISALNRCVNAVYTEADADIQALIAASRTGYGSYMNARKVLLGIIYRDDPMTAAEVMMREAMFEVSDNCK